MNAIKHRIVAAMQELGGTNDEPEVYGDAAGRPGPLRSRQRVVAAALRRRRRLHRRHRRDRHGDPAPVGDGGRPGHVDLPDRPLAPVADDHGLRAGDHLRHDRRRRAADRARQADALAHQRDDARRRPLPRAGPGADHLGPHLHPVGDHARLRALQPAAHRPPSATPTSPSRRSSAGWAAVPTSRRPSPSSTRSSSACAPSSPSPRRPRQFFDFLLDNPFAPAMPDPLRRRYLEFQVHAGMSLMPRWAQELTGFAHSGLAQRLVYAPHLHFTARTLRWAFGVPPWRALADQRVAAASPRPVAVSAISH